MLESGNNNFKSTIMNMINSKNNKKEDLLNETSLSAETSRNYFLKRKKKKKL